MMRYFRATATGQQPMKAMLAKFAWREGFVPLAVLSLYFAVFAFFLARLLPEYERTVTSVFISRAGRISLAAAAASLIIFLVLRKLAGETGFIPRGERKKFAAADLLLLLLPLTPVVQYLIKNRDIFSPADATLVLAGFALFSLALIIFIPALLGKIGSAGTLAILGMAFAFIITDMASLSARYRWFETGNLRIQLPIFGGVFLVARLLYRGPNGRKLLYLLLSGYFLANTLTHLAAPESNRVGPESGAGENPLVKLTGSRTPLSRPNIYFLVYDSYVVNETMLAYGIDNHGQQEYLEEKGFKTYPHAYSVGEYTIPSISRTMEVSADYYGSRRRGISGSGTVHRLLKQFGYRTYGICQSNRFFQGIGSGYDYSFPEIDTRASAKLLAKAILMGEFRFDVAFDRPTRERFVEYKTGIFDQESPEPRFVYMHDYLPGHSQISGECLPNETELFRERLAEANRQMQRDVETIIRNDPGAIIIVAGDHGPYLTKNCVATGNDYDISEISRLDIQDRFGAFLSIRWPDENFSGYDEITVLQDIFPAVFAYIFQDRQFLESRIEPRTLAPDFISDAEVIDGIIRGGIHDGEPLFLGP